MAAYLVNTALCLNFISLTFTASHLVVLYKAWFRHSNVCGGLSIFRTDHEGTEALN